MLRYLRSASLTVLLVVSIAGGVAQGWSIGNDVTLGGPEGVCFLAGGHSLGDNSGRIQIDYVCSGTLITPTEVLTAAHCATPLKEDPKMKLKVLCGYKQAPAAGESIATAFKEVYTPASIDVNQKFMINDTERNGNSTNDFAVIHLPTASKIQSIALLSPLQSIQEFLSSTRSVGFQCEEVGYGLDAKKEPMNLQSGEINSENVVMTLTFEKNPKGMITNGQQVYLTDRSDIETYAKMDAQRIVYAQKGKDEEAEDLTIQEFLFLNSHKLIKNSLMPGDSGGPLLCRHDEKSPWMVVGVASTLGLPAAVSFEKNQVQVAVDKQGRLPLEIMNTWVTPDLSEITKQIWSAQ